MARHIEDEVKYYYDSHPTEEDLMGETDFHRGLVTYLTAVLTWLFHERLCAIYANLNFYQTADPKEYPLAPDMAIIPGIAHRLVRSWRVGRSGPAPQVVFEIASEETWHKDLTEKPGKYAQMGVQEYFAYDPNEPPLSRRTNQRLFGWHLDASGRHMTVMQPRSNGSLWSPSLESRLVPDGTLLRLYDRTGQMRLTQAEKEHQEAELARQQAEKERQEADLARQLAELARQQAEAEARRSQVYAEKLRSLGINPDQLI
jgi:Uma2 family endonuclease